MLQHFRWHVTSDSYPGTWWTDSDVDMAEYAMNLLGNIAHSGVPDNPNTVPEYLNFSSSVANWKMFDAKHPKKNFISMADRQSSIVHTEEQFSDERLNHFYVARELIKLFEADRQGYWSQVIFF